MISLKKLSEFIGISNELLLAVMIAHDVANNLKIDLVLTSGTDWIHSEKSDHYIGNAVDIRINKWTLDEKAHFIRNLKNQLNGDYFILEHKTHIHISFRPSGDKRMSLYIQALKSKGYKIIKDIN